MSRDIDRYRREYVANYGFERTLVAYRRRLLIERLLALRPQVVLEVGCGPELLYAAYLEHATPVLNWTAVEPTHAWCLQARNAALPGMSLLEGLLENIIPTVLSTLVRSPDVVICSGVLHEVPSAHTLLEAMRATMGRHSLLHVNVPNATSLHRRLALAMGLIPSLDTISARNVQLQQHRVYDFRSLSADIERAGLRIEGKGGYLVKPFTHAQMESIASLLGEAVLDGLFELGKREPDLACEIFVEARLA